MSWKAIQIVHRWNKFNISEDEAYRRAMIHLVSDAPMEELRKVFKMSKHIQESDNPDSSCEFVVEL